MTRGFSSIGLVRPKDHHNVGAILRASHAYGVSLVAVEGDRTKIRSHVDTSKAWKHIPVIRHNSLEEIIPYDAVPVAIDLVPDATNLGDFVHPERAFYIFGPEDGTLGIRHIAWCKYKVMIPTQICLNLASCVSTVLYDRWLKRR